MELKKNVCLTSSHQVYHRNLQGRGSSGSYNVRGQEDGKLERKSHQDTFAACCSHALQKPLAHSKHSKDISWFSAQGHSMCKENLLGLQEILLPTILPLF